MSHIHHWSNDTQASHCDDCELPLWAYVAWLEIVATRAAALDYRTTDAEVRAVIELARARDIGSDLTHGA